jgi:hypothetical protein
MSKDETWTLRIEVHGLSLWINQGDHIDVLFPDDRQADPDHHFVTLEGPGRSTSTVSSETIDLRPLARTAAALMLDPEPLGWLPVDVEVGSPASMPNAATSGRNTIAALQLPNGRISALPDGMKGPFTYQGETLQLSYGLAWTFTGTAEPSLIANWISHKDQTSRTEPLGQVDEAATAFTYYVRCLSASDRANDRAIQPEEQLAETQFVGHLSRKDEKLLPDAPVYGGQPIPPSARSAHGLLGLDTIPDKPCPPSFSRPFRAPE